MHQRRADASEPTYDSIVSYWSFPRQWKTLSKDAVPSQNLPKLNPDGTVMVIRKTRTIKTEDVCLSGLYGLYLVKYK
ncbi:hypothetical protein EVAR_54478_1 [Eumeta japonica]|uniref:Uncharacterized protein n=1 Tax=Eumeta variegata TaxID=151549 RepID=A0A4C1YSK1_EUMVA|nr:hypothetical protein EVAR_54478_1 [Eumeta japonica]